MALPVPLLNALSGLKDSATELLPAEQAKATAKARWLSAIEDVRLRAVRLKERAEKLREELGQLESSIADPGITVVDLDIFIDNLEESEHTIKNAMAPSIRRLKAIRGSIFSAKGLSSAERARAIAVPERYEKLLAEALGCLRDTRWRIMTRRAELESPGDAPIFDDPEALIAYLNAR